MWVLICTDLDMSPGPAAHNFIGIESTCIPLRISSVSGSQKDHDVDRMNGAERRPSRWRPSPLQVAYVSGSQKKLASLLGDI